MLARNSATVYLGTAANCMSCGCSASLAASRALDAACPTVSDRTSRSAAALLHTLGEVEYIDIATVNVVGFSIFRSEYR